MKSWKILEKKINKGKLNKIEKMKDNSDNNISIIRTSQLMLLLLWLLSHFNRFIMSTNKNTYHAMNEWSADLHVWLNGWKSMESCLCIELRVTLHTHPNMRPFEFTITLKSLRKISNTHVHQQHCYVFKRLNRLPYNI